MQCKKCHAELPPGANFCPSCGKKQVTTSARGRRPKSRPNGSGTAYKRGRTWTAEVVLGWKWEDETMSKRLPVRRTKGGFPTKAAALDYLPTLRAGGKQRSKQITFKALYDLWQPTHGRDKSTMNCYAAAFKHFEPVWWLQLEMIDIDDLQECMDDCPAGRRTRENMKALCGLMYKYGIPRDYVPKDRNLAQFLRVTGDAGKHRIGFSAEQRKAIEAAVGTVPYADYIYCCYMLGFRPSELLALDAAQFDRDNRCLRGGAKTEAGRDRVVTISPKILPIIKRLTSGRTTGQIFHAADGSILSYRQFKDDCFYPALAAIGIDNPVDEDGRHKYTPHCCRHTFATMLKLIQAPDKDKLAIIGHTSPEMLRHYQDVNYDDLRRITDAL